MFLMSIWEATAATVAYLLDNGQDPWFTVVVTVSTNAKVDLFRVGVSDVSCSESEDAR